MLKKISLIFILFLVLILAWKLDIFTYLNFDFLKSHLTEAESYYHQSPLIVSLAYFVLYIFIATISFPGGATILTLLGGAVMGFLPAFILVSFASTIGATLAFLISRFLLRDFFEKKFRSQAKVVKEEVEQNGIFYLLSLRLMPVIPFFLINILMGLTSMKTHLYFIVSQIGMLPGVMVYTFAGRGLARMNSPRDILSLKIIAIFTLLAVFPLLAKYLLEKARVFKLYRPYRKPKKIDYNTIVIGAGSGGLVSAFITTTLKARVLLIEKNKMGGDCLNTGCIPSKALIEISKMAALLNTPLDFSRVMEQVKKSQAEIEPHDSVERYTKLGVHCLFGKAEILSPFEVRVNQRIHTTENIIIATGAKPRIPSIPGIGEIECLTSENLWELKTLPKKFLIIGGGPIGCEMAQAFHRLGSEVTLLEAGKELLSKEDSDISSVIEKKFRALGIQLYFYTEAKEFFRSEDKKILRAESLGKEILLEFDDVLFAAGRVPNVQGFGLEKLGLVLNKNETIKTNVFMQTNFPNIYACGDVAGPYQLTHMASYQAWFAAVNSLFGKWKKFSVDYRSVSWCTFTEPEVATAGMNEKVLKEKEIEYEVTIFPFKELDRAIVDQRKDGFIKVLTKKNSDRILGASIVGHQAGILIMEFVTAIKFKHGLKDIMNTIHPYPTLSEGSKYAAGVWQKNHAPVLILRLLEKFFKWKRG